MTISALSKRRCVQKENFSAPRPAGFKSHVPCISVLQSTCNNMLSVNFEIRVILHVIESWNHRISQFGREP